MASPDITYAGQIVAEAPEIQAYKLGLLKAAQEQVAKPITLPAYQAAGLSDLQQTAAGAGKAYADIGQGVGAYAPFMQSGANLLGGAGSAFQEAGKGIAGINVAPQYQLGQQGMLTAAQTAANISPYVDLMGAAYKNIGTGSQTLGSAQQGLQAAGATAGGISPYAELMGAGYANIGTGSDVLRTAGQFAGGAAQMFDPAAAQGFMNPYQQQVIDQALQQINRQGDIARQGLAAQAVRSGSFGGTREGVQRAELERNLSEMRNQTILGGLQSGYQNALQQAQGAFEAQQARQGQAGQSLTNIGQAFTGQGLAGANLAGQQAGLIAQQAGLQGQLASQLGQIGQAQTGQGLAGAQVAGQQAGTLGNLAQLQSGIAQGIGSLAGQQAQTELQKAQGMQGVGQGLGALGQAQAGLGAQAQALAQGDINTYLALGGMQQQAAQQTIDANRATQLQQTMMPYQQIGFLSDIYKGAPTTQSVLTAGAAPGTSPLAQAIGTAISGIGAIGAAGKAFP